MDKVERVLCVVEGRRPDRPPVSFWHHFPPEKFFGDAAVAAHVAHVEAHDLDFLKIMHDNGYPDVGEVRDAADLARLAKVDGDVSEFARQLELIAALRRRFGPGLLMATTVFNAFATLRRLLRSPAKRTVHRPPAMNGRGDEPTAMIRRLIDQDADAVKTALTTIAANLATFAARCLQAGADGIFLSVRDDWLDGEDPGRGLYADLVRPGDLHILAAASAGRFNLLHVCGRAVNFRAFAEYPVHVVNWADRAAGPSIAEVRSWMSPAICAGVDNLSTLPHGTPAECAAETRDALSQAGDRPIIIGAGCTYDPAAVPPENLDAVCRSARGERVD